VDRTLAGAGVRLFGSRPSPFVEKVIRALQLKGIAFEQVPAKSPSDFKRWNPQTGKMPVLEVAGERVYDSTFILRKLDQWAPEPSLLSADPRVAARQRFLEDWSDESLYWYVMALRWNDAHADATTAQLAAALPLPAPLRMFVKPILRRQIRGQAIAQGLARQPLDRVLSELELRFQELDVMLGDALFFYSDRISAADLAIFGQLFALSSGPTPDGAALLEGHPALREHYRRVDEATATRGAARDGKQKAA
jgi:glutathione S-transferase